MKNIFSPKSSGSKTVKRNPVYDRDGVVRGSSIEFVNELGRTIHIGVMTDTVEYAEIIIQGPDSDTHNTVTTMEALRLRDELNRAFSPFKEIHMKLFSSPVLAMLAVGGFLGGSIIALTVSRRNAKEKRMADITSEIEILRAANQTLDTVYAHETEDQRNERRQDHIRRMSDLCREMIDLTTR